MIKRMLLLGLLLPAMGLQAGEHGSVETGGLTCYKVEGGYNYLVTSKALMRCVFKNSDALEAWYKGESGVKLGVSLKWDKQQTLHFAVLSSTSADVPEGDFLSGSYAGAGAEASLGVGIGARLLVGGSDKTTSLKPAIETSEGVGVAAGLTYLNLESDPLNNARIATPRGNRFNQALYSSYFDQAYNDYYSPDYAASDFFSVRALETTTADLVLPSVVTSGEPAAARPRLIEALEGGGREFFPVKSARAQVAFDCWSYRVSSGASAGAVGECKDRFWRWQTPLEGEVSKLVAAEMRKRLLMKARVWSIYFDTDSTELSDSSQVVVNDLVAIINLYKEAVVYVEGRTDRAGSKQYNLKLSDKRAQVVQRELIRAGIPREWISDLGYGEKEALEVSTNIHDGSNRRVDIRLVPITVDKSKL